MIRVGALSLALGLLLFSTQSFAEAFTNSYVTFSKPPNWTCKMEGTEWICVNKFAKKAKEAIIILTAKEVGPTDSLSKYEAYLKTPKTLHNPKGKATRSKVLNVKSQKINDQLWVDGMHVGSEVNSYYTRYLATIKNGLAILVTFSAHKIHYTKYTNDFIRAVKSLRVTVSKDFIKNPNIPIGARDQPLIKPLVIPTIDPNSPEVLPSEPKKNKYTKLLGIVLILGALGLYLLIRKK